MFNQTFMLLPGQSYRLPNFISRDGNGTWVIVGCTCVATVLVTLISHKHWSNWRRKLTEHKLPDVIEVLFFTEKYSLCYKHSEYGTPCQSDDCGLEKLKKIIRYIESATTSLDVCVYTITSFKLANAILRKFKEGVRVRVITDASMSFGDGSQIPEFRKEGVLIRARQSQFLMHHKFAVIDGRLLINGSFNWTATATFGNWENVTITSVPEVLVQKYAEQFETLWSELS